MLVTIVAALHILIDSSRDRGQVAAQFESAGTADAAATNSNLLMGTTGLTH